jgi:succinyl-diaminopimelate desuccinylase
VGDAGKWSADPFAAEIRDGVLVGRGAADMKGGVAAFAAAAARFLATGAPFGSIGFLITGDEEGDAVNGTPKMLSWLEAHGETIDHALFGEPTSIETLCDTLKIGRRGSLNVTLAAHGTQGHVAYAAELKNPVHALAALADKLASTPLDAGSALFDPSTLSFSTFDTGNETVNVVPAEAHAAFNIRFNDCHTPESLVARIESEAAAVAARTGCQIDVKPDLSGLAGAEKPGPYTDLLQKAVASVTGMAPVLSTAGGTSDARFMTGVCPAVELGLHTATIHRIDECVRVADLEKLADVYLAILSAYFKTNAR